MGCTPRSCYFGALFEVVAVTGHRPWQLSPEARSWVRVKLVAAAEHLAEHHGMRVGLSGMAQGPDMWWADAVHRAGLALGVHIPCKTQTAKWTSGERREWERLCSVADPAHSVFAYADEYTPAVMFRRNEGMIDAARCLVAVYDPDHRQGGTRHAVGYANRRQLPGFHLGPPWQVVRRGLPALT